MAVGEAKLAPFHQVRRTGSPSQLPPGGTRVPTTVTRPGHSRTRPKRPNLQWLAASGATPELPARAALWGRLLRRSAPRLVRVRGVSFAGLSALRQLYVGEA